MLYQSDAHHYYKMMRCRQRIQRIKGVLLITLSLVLMFYAVPCFAASLWDDGYSQKNASSTTFSSAINDNAYAESDSASTAEAVQPSKEAPRLAYTRASAKMDPLVSETTGPGLLSDDQAVGAAKKRAEAISAATAEKNARMQAQEVTIEPTAVEEEVQPQNLILMYGAFAVSVICALLGMRIIFRARRMRGRAITAAYSSALRAF